MQKGDDKETIADITAVTAVLTGAVALLLQLQSLKERVDLAQGNIKAMFTQENNEH